MARNISHTATMPTNNKTPITENNNFFLKKKSFISKKFIVTLNYVKNNRKTIEITSEQVCLLYIIFKNKEQEITNTSSSAAGVGYFNSVTSFLPPSAFTTVGNWDSHGKLGR
ncbi:MAG: hypothetical protein AAB968_01900 [Patescibacteria group bacterium]